MPGARRGALHPDPRRPRALGSGPHPHTRPASIPTWARARPCSVSRCPARAVHWAGAGALRRLLLAHPQGFRPLSLGSCRSAHIVPWGEFYPEGSYFPSKKSAYETLKQTEIHRESPGGPVVRTQRFHCCGPGSVPGRGTKILQALQRGRKREREIHSLVLPSDCVLGSFEGKRERNWSEVKLRQLKDQTQQLLLQTLSPAASAPNPFQLL